jgi:2-oxoisovalerate dehydrogenase E2 component (dihydrolipoyl transacylase)
MAEITMPHLGESVTEGTIGRWLKQPGEWVEQDEPLVEVTTDKVNTEMPAPVGGVLQTIVAPEGATVAVGAQIATISVAGEAVPDPEPVTNQDGGEASGPTTAAPMAAATPTEQPIAESAPETTDGAGERRRFTPVVLRLAEQHDIAPAELGRVPGTGLGGRVNKQDLLDYIAAQGKQARPEPDTTQVTAPPTAPPAPEAATLQTAPPQSTQVAAARAVVAQPAPAPTPAAAPGETVALTPMRRAIAEHMVRSLATAPHAWTMIEVDMTRLVRFRAAQNAAFRAREGFSLSYVPFVIEATVAALKDFPIVNASFGESGITLKRELNIGLAVALPEGQGLLVPVIKGADGLSTIGLARAVNDLATRARAGRLRNDDLSGGTFTVNNPGSYGSVLSQPIINQPQAAILTMEAIVKRPVVLTDPATGDDTFAVRSLMNMCISFDHRILDGQTAGLFLGSIRQRLEGFSGAAGL